LEKYPYMPKVGFRYYKEQFFPRIETNFWLLSEAEQETMEAAESDWQIKSEKQ